MKTQFKLGSDLPHCLTGAPLLLPSLGTQLRACIDRWLDKHRIHPLTIAEFDDSALMKAFGREGVGIFSAPAAIDSEVERQYDMTVIGRVDEGKEYFCAMTVERRIMRPVASAVIDAGRDLLFADQNEGLVDTSRPTSTALWFGDIDIAVESLHRAYSLGRLVAGATDDGQCH